MMVGGINPPPMTAAMGGMASGGVAMGGAAGGAGDRIYVKGLPAGMTDQSVRDLFGAYGVVADSKVLVSDGKSNDGLGQSVAIVRMQNEADAAWLIENLNGNIPEGAERPVEVTYASKGAGGAGGAAGGGF